MNRFLRFALWVSGYKHSQMSIYQINDMPGEITVIYPKKEKE